MPACTDVGGRTIPWNDLVIASIATDDKSIGNRNIVIIARDGLCDDIAVGVNTEGEVIIEHRAQDVVLSCRFYRVCSPFWVAPARGRGLSVNLRVHTQTRELE